MIQNERIDQKQNARRKWRRKDFGGICGGSGSEEAILFHKRVTELVWKLYRGVKTRIYAHAHTHRHTHIHAIAVAVNSQVSRK